MKYILFATITMFTVIACGDNNNSSGSDQNISDSATTGSTPLPHDVEVTRNPVIRSDSATSDTVAIPAPKKQ